MIIQIEQIGSLQSSEYGGYVIARERVGGGWDYLHREGFPGEILTWGPIAGREVLGSRVAAEELLARARSIR